MILRRCSFCRKDEDEAKHLVLGVEHITIKREDGYEDERIVAICQDCIIKCNEILDDIHNNNQ